MTWNRARKRIERSLSLIGAALLLYLVYRVGINEIWLNLRHFGWWLLATCLLSALWLFFQALAWWRIQAVYFTRVPLLELYRVKFISDAFNLILPSASMGGDAMRAFLIKPLVPLHDGIPGVMFDKTIEFVASIIFLAAGLSLGLLSLRLPTAVVVPAAVSVGITAVGTVLLVVIQRNGVTNSLLRVCRIVPRAHAWIVSREKQFAAMDDNLRLLYSGSILRALLPLLFHIANRLTGVFEFMIVLAVLGAPVTFVQALFIAAIVTVGNTVFFLLPGQWGVMESIHIVVLQSLGYPAAVGLSLSIIRRVRRLVVVGFSLVLFATRKRAAA